MNYKEWSENYVQEAKNLKKIIEREKEKLRNAENFDDIKSINRRLQILKSMYNECVLTARLLSSRIENMQELAGDTVA